MLAANKEKGVKPLDHIPLEAEAIGRLVCKATGRTVGVEYLWETGQTSTLWVGQRCDDAERRPIHPKSPAKD